MGVNHLEAHISANFIGQEEPERYVSLLVSGGHTILSFHGQGTVEVMGETVDDACGEAYDKVAKILDIGFPGGPAVDRLAREGNPEMYRFTRPRQKNPFDFSFSGVKTAVLYLTRDQKEVTPEFQKDVAASFQACAVDWMVSKTLAAAEEKRVEAIVVGGGVSANSALRDHLNREAGKKGIRVFFPPMPLTGDNAAMIARRGIDLFERGSLAGTRGQAQPVNFPVVDTGRANRYNSRFYEKTQAGITQRKSGRVDFPAFP